MTNPVMMDFWIYALIPLNILAILTFCVVVLVPLTDSDATRVWSVMAGFFTAFIISFTVCDLNSVSASSPARPMAAMGLVTSSTILFTLGTVIAILGRWIKRRKDFCDAVNLRVEEMLAKKAKEVDETLKRHGL